MNTVMRYVHYLQDLATGLLKWILRHKMLVFVYLPLAAVIAISGYVGVIYLQWRADRDQAIQMMARYKQLIDRTEEMREGLVYQSSDVDLSAKVVNIPTRIYDRNGEIIGEFFEQKREIVPFSYIPKALPRAVIASEDRRFYEHNGINYLGIMRAFLVNMANFRVVQGGSTITQQLAKVMFTDMDRSIKRKIYEMFCAHEIESRYDKQDILSMYLNLIYFGTGAYGVESTSKMFFGKSVRELNDVECAMIVGTISNPMIYSPLSNLNNSINKTRRIMKSTVDAGFLTQEQADYQYQQFLRKWDVKFDKDNRATGSLIGSFTYSTYRVNRAPFFNEHVRRQLTERFGESVVKGGGLAVYTTIDADSQDVALEALRKSIQQQRAYHQGVAKNIRDFRLAKAEMEKSENIEGALVSVDPETGEILAYVGGYNFTAQNQYDHVSQMRRQPGSSFKPLVYCSAIQNGDITPATVVVDEKTTFDGKYSPNNYSGTYAGRIIVREALKRSINIVAVKILDMTGYSTVLEYLEKGLDLNSSELSSRFKKTLSMALGTYEISPLENARMHCYIVNGGRYVMPYGIRYVKDYNGNIVWNPEEDTRRDVEQKRSQLGRIIDPAAAAITVNMLKSVFEPYGTAAGIREAYGIKFPVAGKTGTSTDYNDAWFVGYTSNLVTAVWVGNKTGAVSLGAGRSGGMLAAPVWGQYIVSISRKQQPKDFSVPETGLVRQTICLDSGLVPHEDGTCPRVSKDELFISGTEPGDYCPLHPGKAATQENGDEEE